VLSLEESNEQAWGRFLVVFEALPRVVHQQYGGVFLNEGLFPASDTPDQFHEVLGQLQA
jgi:hypothetical protein